MKHHRPHHVLVYRLSALGDVAMTIPAIYSCARAYHDTIFHVVTTSFCAQLFANTPKNIVLHPVEKPIGTWHLLKTLNKMEVDAIADLHNVLRSWIVDAMFLLKGKRVKMLAKYRGERHAILKKGKSTKRPFTLRYFDVFEQLGLPCEPRFTSLYETLPPLPVEFVKGDEQWIGIAPYARYENKTYPLEQMQQVVQLLTEREDTRVFLFGSRGEQADTLQQWEKLSPRIHSVAGHFPLQQELALIAHLDVMLSMDSANHHIASLVGTRVVSVWGSTTPDCGFMGWQQKPEDVVCLHLSCQPCTIGGSKHCYSETLDCLKLLSQKQLAIKILKR